MFIVCLTYAIFLPIYATETFAVEAGVLFNIEEPTRQPLTDEIVLEYTKNEESNSKSKWLRVIRAASNTAEASCSSRRIEYRNYNSGVSIENVYITTCFSGFFTSLLDINTTGGEIGEFINGIESCSHKKWQFSQVSDRTCPQEQNFSTKSVYPQFQPNDRSLLSFMKTGNRIQEMCDETIFCLGKEGILDGEDIKNYHDNITSFRRQMYKVVYDTLGCDYPEEENDEDEEIADLKII